MKNKEIDEDFTGNELDLPCDDPNSIRIKDVFEFLIESSPEEVRRIIKFAEPFSGLCSSKEAADQRGIKPSSYCENKNYEKFKFIGKTFGVKKS